ncbi:hypothetical protein Q5P01_000753 [Channa striata]|uniref:Uncharacterized protein n=1 Tax=Channa striata TaxID=64152 RepID=A0AA88IZJ9_CHASR|nr:hypothetical protein Q5P01_000753 [Channa striata]
MPVSSLADHVPHMMVSVVQKHATGALERAGGNTPEGSTSRCQRRRVEKPNDVRSSQTAQRRPRASFPSRNTKPCKQLCQRRRVEKPNDVRSSQTAQRRPQSVFPSRNTKPCKQLCQRRRVEKPNDVRSSPNSPETSPERLSQQKHQTL